MTTKIASNRDRTHRVSQSGTSAVASLESWGDGLELRRFWLDALRLSEAAFTAAHPHAVLVLDPFQAQLEAEFSTQPGRARQQGHLRAVVELRKRLEADPFKLMVTIGRGKQNDICIPAPEISKFHAYFMLNRSTLSDAGSTFGTCLEGEPLEPRTPTPLASGARLRMGPIPMQYWAPRELYDHLRTLDLA